MQEKILDLYEYAKRVNEFSPKKEVATLNSGNKLKGMKLPTMEFSLDKKRASPLSVPPMKNPQKMNMTDFDSKRVSFVRAAYVTYKCCQNQDLHLFQLKKIYFEQKFVLKGVVGWKLPKRKIVQQQLKSLVEGLKFRSSNHKSHLVTWIAQIKKSEEEKSHDAQLELQKQGKEKRNYSVNKPIF